MFKTLRAVIIFSNNQYLEFVTLFKKNSNYLEKNVEKGIGKLSKFNLTFDLLITTEQIKSAISLVEKLLIKNLF